MLRHWSLRSKIIAIATSAIVVVTCSLFFQNSFETKHNMQQDYVARARNIVLTAESVREEMARKWNLGLFSRDQMVDWASQGDIEKVLASVPVVTAWKSAMAKAEEGGYEFRVPNFNPRNPKNAPDELESRALKAFQADPELAEYWEKDASCNTIRYFRPVRLTHDCLLCHGDPATSAELWGNNRGVDPTGGMMEDAKEGDLHGAFEIVQSLDEADARMAQTYFRGFLVAAGLVVASGLVLFLIVRRTITRPLQHTVRVFESIADGDLTHSLTVNTSDEIGQMRAAADRMVGKLRDVVDRMDECTAKVGEASVELSQTSSQLTAGAESTTRRSSTVAAAAEEMTANMNGMASSTENLSQNIKNVATAVEQMTAAIEEVAHNAESTAQVTLEATELAAVGNTQIADLGSAASEIGAVASVIQDIAEQTNLLALNATIEAARAGESGKGFAVVATEVKELAKQTAEATEDIRRRIEAIQSSSEAAINAIGNIGSVIDRVNDASRTIASAVEEQSVTTREIAHSIADAARDAEQASMSVQETSAATREIAENIVGVDRNANRTKEDAERTRSAGDEMSHLSGELQMVVGTFKTRKRFRATPVKLAHDAWRVRLSNMLAGQETFGMSKIAEPEQCGFCQWYQCEGKAMFDGSPTFQAIDTKHADIHKTARAIVQLYNDGEPRQAANKLDDFVAASHELFGLLDQLEREANRDT